LCQIAKKEIKKAYAEIALQGAHPHFSLTEHPCNTYVMLSIDTTINTTIDTMIDATGIYTRPLDSCGMTRRSIWVRRFEINPLHDLSLRLCLKNFISRKETTITKERRISLIIYRCTLCNHCAFVRKTGVNVFIVTTSA